MIAHHSKALCAGALLAFAAAPAFGQTYVNYSQPTPSGPTLYVGAGAGASLFTGSAEFATAIDLDRPIAIAGSPEFDGFVGTAFSAEGGVILSSGFMLGAELLSVSAETNTDTVVDGLNRWSLDSDVSSTGALGTAGFMGELGDGINFTIQGGVGYFANTADAVLTEQVTATTINFDDREDFGLGYSLNAGLEFELSSDASVKLGVRYVDAVQVNTGFDTSTAVGVIDYGNLTSVVGSIGATIKF